MQIRSTAAHAGQCIELSPTESQFAQRYADVSGKCCCSPLFMSPPDLSDDSVHLSSELHFSEALNDL